MATKHTLPTTITELNLSVTLPSGQAFRWVSIGSGRWRGVLGPHVVTLDQSSPDSISVEVHPQNEQIIAKLTEYFQLDHQLSDLYKQWSTTPEGVNAETSINAAFAQAGARLTGMRLLRQDPHECLFSFICSQNNNIKRITGMIRSLCQKYGSEIAEIDGTVYHTFPTLEQLEKATEGELQELGFGYRARYIVLSVQHVRNMGSDWLPSLRKLPTERVQKNLMEMSGVGRKVADCVALFSLDKLEIVPVDTHVFQIASRYIGREAKKGNVTPALHDEIGTWFRAQFGSMAGWAHSVLFAAELKAFQPPEPVEQKKESSNEEEEEEEAPKKRKRRATRPAKSESKPKRTKVAPTDD